MTKHNIINKSDKEEYCSFIYDELILATKRIIIKCQSYTSVLNVKLPISCYTNFRDALFHFYKMNLCVTDIDVYNQSFAIKEHLSRAETDAINNMIVFFSNIIEILLKKNIPKIEDSLRYYLHYMRKIQLNKRIGGMMVFDKNKPLLNADINSVLEKIDDFLTFIQDNDLAECMCKIISEEISM